MITFEYKQPTLIEVIKNIELLSKKYEIDFYFEGKGNGTIKINSDLNIIEIEGGIK